MTGNPLDTVGKGAKGSKEADSTGLRYSFFQDQDFASKQERKAKIRAKWT